MGLRNYFYTGQSALSRARAAGSRRVGGTGPKGSMHTPMLMFTMASLAISTYTHGFDGAFY